MIQNLFGSVRQSLVFRTPDGDESGSLVGKIGTCIRKSRVGLFSRSLSPALPAPPPPILKENNAPQIRWRKGELIGCGAFGRVYMGMNLDSGELLAVKQVLIASNNASKEKAQAHVRELEEEVTLLKNLSHPNIVRYLGTVREEETLNILLEFVPGGSISSLLGKFGSFPETVIRMYTKQLLLGLEYLHKNGIMHRDIKGANILVDNKGCIKLADFGASKQVVELATMTGAKSMKGTPYWMAPEVILQTGHSFSADIWSVGCTIIEMATGKPPWSQQFQEVAALFHIGTTKSHPPIPDHLSEEAKDFLLKCLQKEAHLRATASELLQHPFVTGEYLEMHPVCRTSTMEHSEGIFPPSGSNLRNSSINLGVIPRRTCSGLKDICDMRNSVRCSTIYPEKFSETDLAWRARASEDDMCLLDDKDGFSLRGSVNFSSTLLSDDLNKSFNPMCEPADDLNKSFNPMCEPADDLNKSFNPMCEPADDLNKSFNPMCEPADNWQHKFDESSELEGRGTSLKSGEVVNGDTSSSQAFAEGENNFTFPTGPSVSEDDDEVTESKIIAFLDEKALDLKKLQTPLYEEFYNNTLILSTPQSLRRNIHDENATHFLKLPPKSRSPSHVGGSTMLPNDSASTPSPGSRNRRMSNFNGVNNKVLQEITSPKPTEWRGQVDSQKRPLSPSESYSERQRKWKEELDQELERKREMMRQAGVGGKTSSPKDRVLNRQRDRLRFGASPVK